MSTVLDQPGQINAWYVLSAISQLSSEISTGQNWYGRTSVYAGIRRNLIDGLPPRATLQNKCLALATLIQNSPQPEGPVTTRAREVFRKALADNGWEINAEI